MMINTCLTMGQVFCIKIYKAGIRTPPGHGFAQVSPRRYAPGLAVGDRMFYQEPNLASPEGRPVCIYALGGLISYLSSFGRNTEKEDWINTLQDLQCPDPVNTVVFSLNRIKK